MPFANRVAHGRFAWNGRKHRITLNAPPQLHALHGLGWERAWAVAASGADSAILSLDHPGDGDWPFAFHAEQEFRLDAGGLAITLSAENRADEPAPVGLGLHPFFPASADTRLQADVVGVWLTAEGLPTSHVPAATIADLASGPAVADIAGTDHCFTDWSGQATVGRARIEADGLPFLHVYAPAGETFVCAEPVSHMPDAVNRAERPEATGLRTLAPGERMEVRLRIGRA